MRRMISMLYPDLIGEVPSQMPERKRRHARERRAMLVAQGLCISGAKHGKATHGVLCAKCRLVHRGGPLEARNATPEDECSP